MGAAISTKGRTTASVFTVGLAYYLYHIHYGKRKPPGGDFPDKPPKIAEIPKTIGRSIDKLIYKIIYDNKRSPLSTLEMLQEFN